MLNPDWALIEGSAKFASPQVVGRADRRLDRGSSGATIHSHVAVSSLMTALLVVCSHSG